MNLYTWRLPQVDFLKTNIIKAWAINWNYSDSRRKLGQQRGEEEVVFIWNRVQLLIVPLVSLWNWYLNYLVFKSSITWERGKKATNPSF